VNSSFSEQGSALGNLGIGVELHHDTEVVQRVLLAGQGDGSRLLGAEGRLDFVRVDDAANLGIGEDGAGKSVLDLVVSGALVGTIDGVKLLEGIRGPDDEATNVASRGKAEEVESVDVGKLDAGNVAESSGQGGGFVVDEDGAEALDITSSSHLALSGADLLGVDDTLNVGVSVDVLQESNSLGGLVDGVDGLVVNNERDLGDLVDAVTTGHDEGGDGRGSNGRDQSISALVDVDLSVPSSPDLSGGKHTSTTAHVTEGSLAGSVGTTSRNTRNTSNGTTSSPGLSRGLGTSVLADSVGLTLVLAHASENIMNNVRTNGGCEHGGEVHVFLDFVLGSSPNTN